MKYFHKPKDYLIQHKNDSIKSNSLSNTLGRALLAFCNSKGSRCNHQVTVTLECWIDQSDHRLHRQSWRSNAFGESPHSITLYDIYALSGRIWVKVSRGVWLARFALYRNITAAIETLAQYCLLRLDPQFARMHTNTILVRPAYFSTKIWHKIPCVSMT